MYSMSQREETQKLLGIENQDQDSGDEEQTLFETPPQQSSPPSIQPTAPVLLPTPVYNDSTPATIATGPSMETGGIVFPPVDMSTLPPPPDYSLHSPMVPPKYSPSPGMAVPVNIQMDGRLVPATLMQDPSGNHMVYICEPQTTEGDANTTVSGRPPPPKDHFGLVIIGLFCSFFFLPLAIMALLKSMEVHRRYKLGDYAGAAMASKKAHSWGSASVIFGVFSVLLLITLRYFLAGHQYRRYYY